MRSHSIIVIVTLTFYEDYKKNYKRPFTPGEPQINDRYSLYLFPIKRCKSDNNSNNGKGRHPKTDDKIVIAVVRREK